MPGARGAEPPELELCSPFRKRECKAKRPRGRWWQKAPQSSVSAGPASQRGPSGARALGNPVLGAHGPAL